MNSIHQEQNKKKMDKKKYTNKFIKEWRDGYKINKKIGDGRRDVKYNMYQRVLVLSYHISKNHNKRMHTA